MHQLITADPGCRAWPPRLSAQPVLVSTEHAQIVCMHAHLCAWAELCVQKCPVCSPDSIDTLIFLIQPNLAEIWSYVPKHKVCMHASLHAWVLLCYQTGPACSPDSINNLFLMIQPNLAEI